MVCEEERIEMFFHLCSGGVVGEEEHHGKWVVAGDVAKVGEGGVTSRQNHKRTHN